jgi:hypothetical protein
MTMCLLALLRIYLAPQAFGHCWMGDGQGYVSHYRHTGCEYHSRCLIPCVVAARSIYCGLELLLLPRFAHLHDIHAVAATAEILGVAVLPAPPSWPCRAQQWWWSHRGGISVVSEHAGATGCSKEVSCLPWWHATGPTAKVPHFYCAAGYMQAGCLKGCRMLSNPFFAFM